MSEFIKIEPFDTLFFRKGKPFDKKEDSYTDSEILPYPSTIWGALGSVLWKKDNSFSKNMEKLKIKNLFLYNENQQIILIPAPLDIFIDENENYVYPMLKDKDFLSNYKFEIYLDSDKKLERIQNKFIDYRSFFESYLYGNFANIMIYDLDEVVKVQGKVGNEIDLTKTVKDKHLYRIDVTQFLNDWSFLVEVENSFSKDFDDYGILRFGGEGKFAKYQRVDKPIALKTAEKLKKNVNNKYFKVILTSPTKVDSLNDFFFAVVPKYLSIGGYDVKENKIKNMQIYYPAGSVFYFEKEIFNLNREYNGFGLYEKAYIKV